MAQSDITISEMSNGTFTEGTLFPAVDPDVQSSSGYVNVHHSGAVIGDGIGRLSFPLRLNTENKSIFGAINELEAREQSQIDDTTVADDSTWSSLHIASFLPRDTASGAIASFPDGADNIPVDSVVVQIVPFQSGTGDPSPSNVRPITGHTELNLVHTGANLWDEEWENGDIGWSDGQATITDPNKIRSKNFIPIKGGVSYYLKLPTGACNVFYYDINETHILSAFASGSMIITPPSNACYMKFAPRTAITTYNNDISINYPSTDTSYHAYNGLSVVISFGQNVYGGYINLKTGVLTIDMIMEQMLYSEVSSLTSDYIGFDSVRNAVWVRNWHYQNMKKLVLGGIKANCNAYRIVAMDSGISSTQYRIYFFSPSSVQDFLNEIQTLEQGGSGLFICYELATPTEVTLDPVILKTLYGTNNFFADTGDVSVRYPADIGLYIDKKTA